MKGDLTDYDKCEGYRKALEQIREMHYYDSSATEMRQIAREALSDAATENPNAGHGWITGTADMDAIEGHAMREPVPEAGEALSPADKNYTDMRRFQSLYIKADHELRAAQETIRQRDQQFEQHTKAVGRFLSDLYCTMIDPLAEGESPVTETMAALLKAAQEQRQHEHDQIELIRQRDEVIQESWKQAREWGNELGISAEHLPALICGIGDKFFELQEQRDEQLERIREYSAGEHRGLDMAAIHEIASESTDSAPYGCYCKPGKCTAPVVMGRQMPCRDPRKAAALCPTCKGTKQIPIEPIYAGSVPCPTCTEPK